jgi:hypothetical protein
MSEGSIDLGVLFGTLGSITQVSATWSQFPLLCDTTGRSVVKFTILSPGFPISISPFSTFQDVSGELELIFLISYGFDGFVIDLIPNLLPNVFKALFPS